MYITVRKFSNDDRKKGPGSLRVPLGSFQPNPVSNRHALAATKHFTPSLFLLT